MSLTSKTDKADICPHIAQVMKTLLDLDIGMAHDFQGTYLACPQCDSTICLEAYGDSITEGDIPEE